jgi:hypothetical protein
MLEAMLYGCVSAVSTRVQEHDWSPLSNVDVTWGLPADSTGIAERLNELMANPRARRQIAYRALEFVREYSDARTHAVTILDHMENRSTYGHSPGLLAPEFWDNICSDPVPDMELAQPLAEYTSPHTLVTIVGPEEPEVEEEALVVEEAEEILAPTMALDRIPVPTTDGRWIQFVSGVARAWLDAFGEPRSR